MNIKICILSLLFISLATTAMRKPAPPPRKSIQTTRGLPKKTMTEKLQEFIYPNIETNQRDLFLKTVNEYIDAGASPNIKNNDGVPLLNLVIRAFYHNPDYSADYQIKMIQKLIDKGADVNAVDTLGQTPLTGATASNSPCLVELLLGNGADPNLKTNQGHNAFDIARETGSREAAKALEPYRSKVKIP